MKTLRAAIAISTILLLVSCGDSGPGGNGGSGGSGGSAGSSGGATAGSGGAAGSGSGGSGAGTAGTTGAGGGAGAGWPAVCPGCLSCVMTNCPSQISTCQANAACNAIYECGRTCTTVINTCVAMHLEAIQVWASIQTCITNNCTSACAF